jgi:hypothetical protein
MHCIQGVFESNSWKLSGLKQQSVMMMNKYNCSWRKKCNRLGSLSSYLDLPSKAAATHGALRQYAHMETICTHPPRSVSAVAHRWYESISEAHCALISNQRMDDNLN